MTGIKKCVLIDGHSLAYRAFYALPSDMSTSSGQITNAVYGFTSMLIKILEELKPQSVIVAFDKGRPDFRIEKYPDYKAHRKPMPDELREQMSIIHAVLEALHIPCIEEEGYEADDILATLTGVIPGEVEIYIVTGDRDALQLVDDSVKVVANRKGITDIIIYDPRKVKEKYGVMPEQIVDYLALKGDTSDNIPGIPGIGEKTASALINEYGSLEQVLENLHRIKGGRWKSALQEHKEKAIMSRELAQMRHDVPIDEDKLAEWELKPWDRGDVSSLFSALEFKRLYERLMSLEPLLFPEMKGDDPGKKEPEPLSELLVSGKRELEDLRRSCEAAGELSFCARFEGEGFSRGKMTSLSAAAGDRAFHLDLREDEGKSLLKALLEMLDNLKGLRISSYRGKDIMIHCARITGLMPTFDFDAEIASYLMRPSGIKEDLESVMLHFLGSAPAEKPSGQLDLMEEEEEQARDEMRKAYAVSCLVEPMEAELNRMGLRSLYDEVEIPLQGVLADMEARGIRLDTGMLEAMEREIDSELEELQEEAFELAGEVFNLNSPQQLSRILFEVLGLTPVKRIKTGFATDVGVLNTLKDLHPIAGVLLRYRELSKLRNTYISALPSMVDPRTGRLHTSFNQTVTATGRLSSSNPNLQNIPVRTSLGKRIRKAFLPTCDKGLIVSADYSQIELRVMAHLSGDDGLKKAFEEDLDIHASTASEVFGVSFEEVTPEQRRRAKAINFGIIYGISPYGLAEQLGIEKGEAELYIEDYFRRYNKVRRFLDMQVENASRNGYVRTLLGRRREIPELLSGNVRMKHLGERLAFNTPIQGSAADIIKLAMLHVHERLKQGVFASGMILQVHDELIFDVEKEEEEGVMEIVREEMEGAFDLDVPLKVDIRAGSSWYDAK